MRRLQSAPRRDREAPSLQQPPGAARRVSGSAEVMQRLIYLKTLKARASTRPRAFNVARRSEQ